MKHKLLILGSAFAVALMCGCGSKDDSAPSAETAKQADRLTQIQTKTNGDWGKLSDADKSYLVNDLAHGSESTAKMLLGPSRPAKPAGVGGK